MQRLIKIVFHQQLGKSLILSDEDYQFSSTNQIIHEKKPLSDRRFTNKWQYLPNERGTYQKQRKQFW